MVSPFRLLLAVFAVLSLPVARADNSTPPTSAFSPAQQAELFDALDLTQPGLEAVRQAVGRQDLATAQAEFAKYLRQRTSVRWKFDPHIVDRKVPFNKQIADDAVLGRVQPDLLPLWHSFPDGKIDWLYNATFHTPGQATNTAWQWQLVRMYWWNNLGAAYRATGDERYAQAWAQQLRSFIAQCPVPATNWNANGSPWRTIEAGIRMEGSWPNAYHSFLLSPSVSDETLLLYVYSCLQHARFLETHNTRGNWLTMEMGGLYSVGALFPEFKQAAEWRGFAANMMSDQEAVQFLPDGAQYELSTGYHQVALDNVLLIADLAQLTGHTDELPANYILTLEKAFAYDMFLMAPDGTLPRFNDSWHNMAPGLLKHALKYFPARKDFQWIASDRHEGEPPTETSHAFPWAGFYIMRSGWEPDANYLAFRAGPLGAGHQHEDALDVLIWPYGRELLFGSSGGSYESSKWRDYAISTYAANSVIVDGLAQTRPTRSVVVGAPGAAAIDPRQDPNLVSQAPIEAHWQSTSAFDFASGIYDSVYGPNHLRPATHQRDVLFVKPDLFIIADRLTPTDAAPHQYQARWQLLTTSTQLDPATKILTTTDASQPNLAIVPLLSDGLAAATASAQEEPELLGWNVRKDQDPEYVPATTLLHSKQGAGPKTFLTLFVPLHAGEGNPVTAVQSIPGDASAATVTLKDGRHLTITCAGARGISVKETLPDGKPGRNVAAGTP